MEQQINNILKDLYAIDPNLKAHEKELISLVSELIQSKPDTHFNEQFAAELKSRLLQTPVRPLSSPYASIFVSRIFYGVLSSALTLLIAVPLTFVATQRATSPDRPLVLNPFAPTQVKNNTLNFTPKQQISNKGVNAFGKLDLLPLAPSPSATSDSGSAVSSISSTASSPRDSGVASLRATDGYSYEYKGENIYLSDSQGKVYKRTKGTDSNKQLADTILNSKFNLANLSSFEDLVLKNIEFSENKPLGYVIGVNFEEGSIAIRPQSSFWPEVNNASSSESNLNDNEVLTIANDFVKTHGIETSIYAKPVVLRPSQFIVVYPLIIDGKEVYENNGQPFGLTLTIDSQRKKVSEVTNLTSQIYESSQYKLETDFNVILGSATSTLGNVQNGKAASLETPKSVLMHYWFYDEKLGVNSELFVPALSFGVKYSEGGLPINTVVVPLVQDFLKVSPNK